MFLSAQYADVRYAAHGTELRCNNHRLGYVIAGIMRHDGSQWIVFFKPGRGLDQASL